MSGEIVDVSFMSRLATSQGSICAWSEYTNIAAQPERSARILLTIIKRDPAVVRRALTAA